MGNIVKRGRGFYPLKGYLGGLERLSERLGCGLEEGRIVRVSVLQLFEEGYGCDEVVRDMGLRGYNGDVIMDEWIRCSDIAGDVDRLVSGGVLKKDLGLVEFRNRVMGVGGISGELGKDELVSILSGIILDSRVDVRGKLSAIELMGKYRDYFKSVDRDVRIIIEGGSSSSSGVSGSFVVPDGIEVDGKVGGLGG